MVTRQAIDKKPAARTGRVRLMLLAAYLLLPGLIVPLSGCKKGDSGKVTIGYMAWGNAEQLAVEQQIIDQFEKTHPNIHVKLFMVPSSSYHQKLQIMLASRTAPDVVRVDHYYFPAMVRQDYFVPLDQFFEHDPTFDLKDFHQFAIKEGMYRGKLYGLNMLGGCQVVYYNKTMFKKASLPDPYQLYLQGRWTMDEYVELAKKLTRKDKNGNYTQFGTNLPYPWYPVWAYGGDFLSKDYKRCMLDTPEAIRGLQWIKDLRWKHHVSPTPAEGMLSAFKFESGRMAMMFGWDSYSAILRRLVSDFEWDVAPIPSGPAGRFTCMKGNQLCIYKESRHPKEAWEFIRHVTSAKTEMWLCGRLRRALTMHKSVARDPAYLMPDGMPANARVFVDNMKFGKLIPIDEHYQAWYVEFQRGYELMNTNEMEADEAAKWMVPRINRALREEDW